MISIRRSGVPAFLQDSAFYKSLNVDDDEEIILPTEYCAVNLTVTDAAGLKNLLSTLRFWGVNSIPEELCRVAMDLQSCIFETVVGDYIEELSYLLLLLDIRRSDANQRVVKAASAGNLDLLQYLVKSKHTMSSVACDLSARFGHLACLQCLHSAGCPWGMSTCGTAARYGQLDCLKYAHENGCSWNIGTIAEDAARSSFECLRYVCENGAHLNSSIYKVFARNDDIASLRYVFKHGIPWSDRFMEYAIYHDSLKCLEYALDNQCPLVNDALCNVKSTECIRLIHNTHYTWTAYSSAMVAKSGNASILRYLHELGCPWDENTCVNAVKNKDTCACFKFAVENGCVYSTRTVLMAVKCSNKDALTYIHALGFVFTPDLCAKVVDFHGPGLEMLTFLHSLGCPWDENTTFNAAIYGRLDCLKFAFGHGCPVREDICYEVGMRGEFDVLRYLHTRGCALSPLQFNGRNALCVQYVGRYRVGHTACIIQ